MGFTSGVDDLVAMATKLYENRVMMILMSVLNTVTSFFTLIFIAFYGQNAALLALFPIVGFVINFFYSWGLFKSLRPEVKKDDGPRRPTTSATPTTDAEGASRTPRVDSGATGSGSSGAETPPR